MVRVSNSAINKTVAWRVRDAMARHPSLNSATARISIHTDLGATGQCTVVLDGWTLDDRVRRLAVKLAVRAAGCCPVQARLDTERPLGQTGANKNPTVLISSNDRAPTPG